jgi:hypothetical protein
MEIKNETFCPLLKKDCIGLKCNWFIQLRGKHPQTGNDIDEWECSIKWLPVLLIENAQQTRQGGAAVESLRNEIVKMKKEAYRMREENLKRINFREMDATYEDVYNKGEIK